MIVLKRLMRPTFFCLLFFSLCQQVQAQTKTITGKILNETNVPVSAASVTVKGSAAGTSTDANGNFSLAVPASAKTLIVTYVGYSNLEVSIAGQSNLTITLVSNAQTLNDVVVIGYGTAKKKDLTVAVSTISNKDLNPGPVTSPLQQIAGKAAGVNVIQIGSEPGSAPEVRIRGITSLVGGSDPLVVVDGV